MLTITIPESEQYDSKNNRFYYIKEQTIKLEHSLLSISKWEQKWEKPFLSKNEKTFEELIDYIRCMTITQNVDPIVYYTIPSDVMDQIVEYIDKKMTATWFSDDKNSIPSREIITSEIIYYWMFTYNIPLEMQKIHLNRLMTLIRVCSEKNAPSKKMKKNDIYSRNRALNEARKKALNTRG